jgi:hypothetical protein
VPTRSQNSPMSQPKGFLQSYGSDLRGWATGIALRYVIAIALCIAGTASLIAGAAVGFAALFRWLELHYSATVAYSAVGGGLALLGLIGFLIAIVLFKSSLPPLPRPQRRARELRQSVATRVMLAPALGRNLLRTDMTTEILAGTAAVLLVGWVAASRLGRKPRDDRR